MDEARETFEGGDGVGAHDLRRNEQVQAVDEAGGEESGVEARAGFSEEGENAFFAEFVENLLERDPPCLRGKDFDADAAAF